MISVCGVRLTFVTSSGRLTRTRVANSSFAKFSQYSEEAPTTYKDLHLVESAHEIISIKTSAKVLKVLSTSRNKTKRLLYRCGRKHINT